jgi:hypothetical protein
MLGKGGGGGDDEGLVASESESCVWCSSRLCLLVLNLFDLHLHDLFYLRHLCLTTNRLFFRPWPCQWVYPRAST